jgi:hypothetical protein
MKEARAQCLQATQLGKSSWQKPLTLRKPLTLTSPRDRHLMIDSTQPLSRLTQSIPQLGDS